MSLQAHPSHEWGCQQHLLPGIPLLFEPPLPRSRDRVSLSTGVIDIGGSEHADLRYRETAFVPAEPWRAPTDEEFDLLSPPEARPAQGDFMFVALLALAEAPIVALHEMGLQGATSPEACLKLVARDDFAAILSGLITDLWPYCSTTENLHSVGIAVGPGGLVTSSVSRDRRNRLGLHVDPHASPESRRRGKNRLVINLGTEPRYFMYVNRPMTELAPGVLNPHETFEWDRVLAENTSYPIVRVRLDPCEAYIAPTFDIIHEGSSTDKRHLDVTYSLIGEFRPART